MLLVGSFEQSVNFGGGPLTSAGGYDIFVAKYSPSGEHLWSKGFGSAGFDGATAVSVDASGNFTVTGYFQGTVDFGGGPLTSAGGYDIFVAKYSPSGEHLWSKRFGATDNDYGMSVAVDGNGNVIVTGGFYGTVDFGGGPSAPSMSYAVFAAKYTASGSFLWADIIDGVGVSISKSVAVNGSSNIAVTGYFENTIDFGQGALTSSGEYDIFMSTLTP